MDGEAFGLARQAELFGNRGHVALFSRICGVLAIPEMGRPDRAEN